ncbi:MAG: Rpn family recombination-promoting nuclease/putative transposase [Lachnospiraceae bacterium]|nr:Rpn family recombination-promoting nuclease/putative transposase [Lachnospiraceae bacterium]
MAYGEQIRQKKKENAKRELKPGGEFLYRVKKDDKIFPVSTLVVYWGKGEWDGPKSLHDMIDWGEESEEIKNLVPEYPIHFLDLSKIEHPEYFKTELRPFFELYKNRNNKKEFIEYLRNSRECVKMDAESWDVLGKVTNSPKMINDFKNKMEKNNKAEEEGNMCRALEEFYNDGVAEGRAEGKASAVIELLSEAGEVSKALSDKIYEQKDLEVLKKWLKLAARAESVSEFESAIRL